MKEVIHKYLAREYSFTPITYINLTLIENTSNREVKIAEVFKTLITVFSIDEAEMLVIFDEWAELQAVIVHNKVVDFKYAYFEKYGVPVPSSELEGYIINPDLRTAS